MPYICGQRKVTNNLHHRVKRVIGGKEAVAHSWPWIVNFIDQDNRQQCAGSIIAREWILTAAHCFLFDPVPAPPIIKNYTFHVADHRLNFTDQEEYILNISNVYIHPWYVPGSSVSPGDYDIALVKLSEPLFFSDYVQPVCLAESNATFNENDTCYLVGWGNTMNVPSYNRSSYLKEVRLDLVSLNECNSNVSYQGQISERFICAGRKEGGIDGCYGDSGGSYQCDRNGTWKQLGIMIWGIGCAEPNHYGVYTDVRAFHPFINSIQEGNI